MIAPSNADIVIMKENPGKPPPSSSATFTPVLLAL
jgi:hypothetical protein